VEVMMWCKDGDVWHMYHLDGSTVSPLPWSVKKADYQNFTYTVWRDELEVAFCYGLEKAFETAERMANEE
jgi:hypothetical protein